MRRRRRWRRCFARCGSPSARRPRSRAGWGALSGGLVGAVVGVPVPVIGSVVGGFVGAFAGAALFEYTRARHTEGAAKAGWGAVLGRAAAAALKMALGVAMAVGALFLTLRE